MASTRLRCTFHYPADSEDDDAVEEGMDERDQEDLISNLSKRDTSSTTIYTLVLLILPLAPIILYTPRLFSISTIIQSILAIASLLASAYTLYFLPLPPARYISKPNPTGKGKSIARDDSGAKSAFSAPETKAVPYVSDEVAELLRKYIIPGNGAICVILCLVELGTGRTWSEGMMIGGGYVPGFIFSVVLWARRELRVVDLGELERLRYRTN